MVHKIRFARFNVVFLSPPGGLYYRALQTDVLGGVIKLRGYPVSERTRQSRNRGLSRNRKSSNWFCKTAARFMQIPATRDTSPRVEGVFTVLRLHRFVAAGWIMTVISGEMDLPAWHKSSTWRKYADKSKAALSFLFFFFFNFFFLALRQGVSLLPCKSSAE